MYVVDIVRDRGGVGNPLDSGQNIVGLLGDSMTVLTDDEIVICRRNRSEAVERKTERGY